MESEIFGHEKGAFTGALERRTGCFELAEGGTLLLDEIGEMPIGTQAKLLRVLEDRKLRRLGSKVETSVDVRVLAATNKVPDEAGLSRGELRSDLYYRLNVFNIHMPPLREHKEDIPALVSLLLVEMGTKHSRKVGAVSEAVLNQFNAYSWPGNVRELRNTIERAIIVCDGGVIETKHLPPGFGQAPLRTAANDPDAVRLGVGTTVEEAEKMLILKTLEATSNNKTRAAEILGISLKTLHNKLKEYGSSGCRGSCRQRGSSQSRMLLAETAVSFRMRARCCRYATQKNHHRSDHHPHGDADGVGIFVSLHLAGTATAHRKCARNRAAVGLSTGLRRGK